MQLRLTLRITFLTIVLLLGATIITAQTKQNRKTDPLIDSLFAVRDFNQAAISPDGKYTVYIEALKNKNGSPSSNTAIYLTTVGSTTLPRRITAGNGAVPHSETDVAWSPDSRRLAFMSNAGNADQSQLYVIDVAGGLARKITSVKGFLADPHWSPDGKTIAFLFTENALRASGPLQPMTVETGVIESKIYEQRIATIDLATGKLKQVSPADLYVYEYDWSPDGKRFAATGAHGSGDNNYWIAELYTIDAA